MCWLGEFLPGKDLLMLTTLPVEYELKEKLEMMTARYECLLEVATDLRKKVAKLELELIGVPIEELPF